MIYTKELLHNEFKEVTKKDQSKKKETFTHRVTYLQSLKEDFDKNPKYFSNLSITSQQLQNLIDDWSAPKPIDAFYKRIFGVTYAEKKQQEEVEYMNLDKNDKKTETKKPTEETQSIH
jgi:hypothetical protein|tara:strand:+ start:125 stop:478 length:354 start_codon:yes stop_codon:yes gene_type:complete